MDQQELRLVAHFKVLFTKESGQKIDLVKFAGDSNYAKQTLEIAMRSENEELLVLAMDLMQRRDFLTPTIEPAEEPQQKTADISQKYIGRLR